MKISSFKVILFFIIPVITGIALISTLPIKLNAIKMQPSLIVNFNWSGVSGLVIEKEVTSILEASFSRIRGIKKVYSTSSVGKGLVILDFDQTINIDAVRFEVASIIRQLYPHFPQQVGYPTIKIKSPENQDNKPIVAYTLNSTEAPYKIQKYVENHIKPKIISISGVHNVDIYGAMPLEWVIEYNIEKLQTLKILPAEIHKALNRYLLSEAIGFSLEANQNDTSVLHIVLHNHQNQQKFDINKIPITNKGGRIIFMNDIAKIIHKEETLKSYFRINGENTVNIVITADEYSNYLIVAKNINIAIDEIEKSLPEEYSLLKSYDSTEYIKSTLNKNIFRVLFTIILILLFLFLITNQIKFLVIIILSLLTTLSMSIIIYKIFKIEIYLYTLTAITVSFGAIINNSIVMVFHYLNYKNQKVFLATLASTLATVAALCIVFVMNDTIKNVLIDFSLVIIINILVSLIVSLILVPALVDKIKLKSTFIYTLVKPRTFTSFIENVYIKFIEFSCKYRIIFLLLFIVIFGIPFFKLPEKIDTNCKFSKIYNRTFGSVFYNDKVKPIISYSLGGTFRLFIDNVYDKSSYVDLEKTTLYIVAQLPYGSTIDQINELIKSTEKYLNQFSEIERYQTYVIDEQTAQIEINFSKGSEQIGFPFKLKELVTQKALEFGGANWGIYGVGEGFSNSASETLGRFRIFMYGYNYDELFGYAQNVKDKILLNPRVKEVFILSRDSWSKDRTNEFILSLNNENIIFQNISPLSIWDILYNNTLGEKVISQTIMNGEMERIRMISNQNQNYDLFNLLNYPNNVKSTSIKLKNNTTIKQENLNLDIYKEDQQYRLILAYDYIGSNKLARRLQDRLLKTTKLNLPLGFNIKADENSYNDPDENIGSFKILLIIIIIIYFICSILLESLLLPLAVIFMIPFSYIGIFLTFYYFNLNFDQGGFASFILLSGLTVSSALYLINDYCILKRNKISNMYNIQLYMIAFKQNFKLILVTTFSMIITMLSFISFQKEPFWTSLSSGVIGGLILSLLGIIIYLPILILKKNNK